MNDKANKYWHNEFELQCLTEKNNEVLMTRLHFTRIILSQSKVKMTCSGKMMHKKISNRPDHSEDSNPKLHYLEVEGLEIEFTDLTEEIRSRKGVEIKDYNNWKRDHTEAGLVDQQTLYNQNFYKSDDSKNIIVEFPNDSNGTLSYQHFLEIKRNYMSLLSLINGAEVRTRQEFTGTYYTIGKIDSELIITYSFRNIRNERYNTYIPINNSFNRGDGILSKILLFSFNHYQDWNDKIDLNSIVFYLSNSEQARSKEEKVFIQMIAFERLTTNYAQFLGSKEEFMPSKEEYLIIKNELIEVVDKYKEQFGDSYNTVKSKIGNLNQIKRLSTTDKMYRIVNDVNIPIDKNIENLIDVVRHKTIHNGDIGDHDESLEVFFLLDELLREIILRLIKYEGPRNSRVLLKKEAHQ